MRIINPDSEDILRSEFEGRGQINKEADVTVGIGKQFLAV